MKNLRSLHSTNAVRIDKFVPTGTNSGVAEYSELNGTEVVNTGSAAVFDVDSVELDDNNCLTGNSRLSNSGEFIVVRKPFDRTGLGRK